MPRQKSSLKVKEEVTAEEDMTSGCDEAQEAMGTLTCAGLR